MTPKVRVESVLTIWTVSHIGAAKPVRMTPKVSVESVLTFKTVSHIGAAKPVRMTPKVSVEPCLDVQDGISHQGGEAVASKTI